MLRPSPPAARALLAAGALLVASPALAQDGSDVGLYAPAPPPGAAFVRLVNAGPSGALQGGKVATHAVPPVAAGEASAYVAIPHGTIEVSAGGRSRSCPVEAGGFYTVAFGAGDGPRLLTDPVLTTRVKVEVAMYNLTPTPGFDLATADGKVTVLDDVGAGAVAGRELNPLTVAFAVTGPGGPVVTFPATPLARSTAYSVIVREVAGKPTATWVENRTTSSD